VIARQTLARVAVARDGGHAVAMSINPIGVTAVAYHGVAP